MILILQIAVGLVLAQQANAILAWFFGWLEMKRLMKQHQMAENEAMLAGGMGTSGIAMNQASGIEWKGANNEGLARRARNKG